MNVKSFKLDILEDEKVFNKFIKENENKITEIIYATEVEKFMVAHVYFL